MGKTLFTTGHTRRRTALGLVLLLVIVATLACTLTAGTESTSNRAAATLVPTFAVPSTPFIIPSATSLPTALPTTTSIAPTVFNCTPNTFWPTVVIQAGDTLADIAARTNSTVEQLAQANCLTDPSLIYAGQPLYVPVLPATRTPTATAISQATANPNAPVFTQPLTVNQHWTRSDGKAVTYYASVRVTVDVVNNASHVNFYVNAQGGGSAVFIGQDVDPWDGAFVDYSFAGPGEYTFQARAVNEHMEIGSNAYTVVYDPNFIPPGESQFNRLDFIPHISYADGWFQLQGGTTITISWPSAPVGATRIEFRLAATGTGTGPGQLIGQDLNPSDGALITWAVPGGLSAHVEATAFMPDGSTQSAVTANVYAQ
jgi:LysM repeat protein